MSHCLYQRQMSPVDKKPGFALFLSPKKPKNIFYFSLDALRDSIAATRQKLSFKKIKYPP